MKLFDFLQYVSSLSTTTGPQGNIGNAPDDRALDKGLILAVNCSAIVERARSASASFSMVAIVGSSRLARDNS
jgi:hypothetical protein